ncbi:MAG: ATP-binding protein [Muribaculaceae bacterium]|nr:ATP-binding protein [Muribaculaceae bacterium]
MAKRIKYPVGIQTFSKIISEGYLYVDKTELIYDLVDSSKYVFLSRPRRFGKSLLMSTLEAYFKGKKELFQGLKIAELESEWKSYPVFRFDMSGGHLETPEDLKLHVESYLKFIEKENGLHSDSSFGNKFRELIIEAYQKTGNQVVILIDEYDKPILDILHDPKKQETMRDALRGFYSVIKSCDEYIKFAMLTGITKFGKVSVFSGINNLRDISMLPKYNGICGITDKEFHGYFSDSVAHFAEENSISSEETWKIFKTMYDGYHFADAKEFVYNPFSVLNAFNDSRIGSYWYMSGSPTYLIKLIEKNPYRLNDLEGAVRSEIELSDIANFDDDIVPLLYQSGYLTIKDTIQSMDFDDSSKEYILGFPNREVNKAFWESLSKRFFRGINGGSAFNIRKCVKDINDGHIEDFMLSMKSLFADTNSEPEKDKEIHFQNMMAIACKMLGLAVRTEVHSSSGRCDFQILTNDFVYIFEFKINSTPEEALQQIYEKGYAIPFEADSRTVFLIGANFLTKTRTLDSWIIRKFK